MSEFTEDLDAVLGELRELLVRKNQAYGDSALNPIRCFSKTSTDEQLRVRVDDKLSRMIRGFDDGEEVELDALGYQILLRIHQKRRK